MTDYLRLDDRFTFHPADESQAKRYTDIRYMALQFAVGLKDRCPESPELTLAINSLDQAVMWANASIARNQ